MRLFFGVGLPSGVRKEVRNFCSSVKEKLPNMKWVEEENLHITLRFLGEVDAEKNTSLIRLSDEASREIKAFPVTPGALGAFPNPERARVFWWGVSEGAQECTSLFEKLEARLVKNGFPAEEKAFHPHITLARLKFPAPLPLEKIRAYSFSPFTCNQFTLYESVLRPEGPLYKIVKEFRLG
jgi:2'-5' RNA ligase